ncbi:MAG: phytanoyl-CoA dioxygenase family protein [Planctomycetota bacterium]|nr:phytanoyl-CoA dioxygenase family protein [Planctomycetota bacterium]
MPGDHKSSLPQHQITMNNDHIEDFFQNGFLHIPGLVPPDECEAAEQQVWEHLPGKRDDPSTWPEGGNQPWRHWFGDGNVWQIYEKYIDPIFNSLAGEGLHDQGLTLAEKASPIVIFPTKDKEWSVGGPHVDQHGPIHRTLVLGALVYLHDVPKEAGATAVWRGIFRDLEDMSLERRKLACDLLNREQLFELKDKPVVHDFKTGDALILHRSTPHAGSLNTSRRPRVALQYHAHLNAAGEWHCRTKQEPRTVIERNYDRHFDEYLLFNYFGCRPKNTWDEEKK